MSTLRLARCYQHGAAGPRSRKLWHLSLGFVDGGRRRRRNVYDKKSLRYAKDNRKHLIARSDKSVAYVTNNKRLCSTFCTTEANYWQTRSIARPLCDSRATCLHSAKVEITRLCRFVCHCIILSVCLSDCVQDAKVISQFHSSFSRTRYCEAVGLNVCFLKASMWYFSVGDSMDDAAFRCWQPLDVELHNTQSWT